MPRRLAVLSAVLLLTAPGAFAALQLPNDLVVEATEAGGAAVKYSAAILGPPEGETGRSPHTLTCAPASLSLFPIGTTTVACNASNGETGSFNVTVRDTTAPLLTVPRDFAVFTTGTSQVADFAQWVNAADRVDGTVGVACTPPSGTSFLVGETPVTCTTTDEHGNTESKSFVVIVYNTLPHDLDKDIEVEATGPDGAVVTFDETGCTPASGSLFPIGRNTVTCGTFVFSVTVKDSTPPVFSLPADINVTTSSASGATVTYSATATDIVDGNVAVTCAPASGSLFAVGTTTVNCSATDTHGNGANGSFTVQVTLDAPPPDTAPPVLSLPGNISVEATSEEGAAVSYTASATDAVDGPVPVTCAPPSGSTFAIGTTVVTCSATDSSNNSASGSFSITVVDGTVVDEEAPVITSLSVTPNTLSPPNNEMVEVTITVTVTDNLDPAPLVRIFQITSNEAIGGDTQILTNTTALLRAERDGSGSGRIYTIHVEAVDAHGNRGVSAVDVVVPHDQGGNNSSTIPAPKRRRAVGRG